MSIVFLRHDISPFSSRRACFAVRGSRPEEVASTIANEYIAFGLAIPFLPRVSIWCVLARMIGAGGASCDEEEVVSYWGSGDVGAENE